MASTPGRSAARAAAIAFAAIAAAASCQGYQPIPPKQRESNLLPDGGREPADGSVIDSGDAGIDAGPGVTPECDPTTTLYVYVVAADNTLYRFFPPMLTFEAVGVLDCPDPGNEPYSMAVDRFGTAWVEYGDGNLFKVSTKTAACTATDYRPPAPGRPFVNFGMGFSSNAVNSSNETLWLNDSGATGRGGEGLAWLDTDTFELHYVGNYRGLTNAINLAELTGTGDALLYGGFDGNPFELAAIDKTNAQILSEAPMQAISQGPMMAINFAFAFWGGSFWLFEGPDSNTGVYLYNPVARTTTMVTQVSFVIVGAGVSTCAPRK
jgi:hypothetical protein